MSYPTHIYDQARIDVATSLLQKELRKLFLGLPSGAWQAIDRSIVGWREQPKDFHLEDGTRDFWDIFAAVMESIKLKPSFTKWFTAENVAWSQRDLAVRDIQMTSPLDQLQKVPGLRLRADLPFAELADVLAANPQAVAEQKMLVDQHSTDPAQDDYPIVALKTDTGLYRAMDGNRRTLRALLYGRSHIKAWVGEPAGPPRNFWVPINDMTQLGKVYQQAIETKNEPLQRAVVAVQAARFADSQVAAQAFKERIANQHPLAQQLYDQARSQAQRRYIKRQSAAIR